MMSDFEQHDEHETEHGIIDASFTVDGEDVSTKDEYNDHDADIVFEYGSSISADDEDSYITIKPIRFMILILLILAMFTGKFPVFLGGGIIAVYFGIKLMIKRFFQRMLMIPFAMKGKALAGATVEVHGYEWTETPRKEGEVVINLEGVPLRYVWIDVTIAPPGQSEGFVQWEPGDLMLCPTWFKIKQVSDLDVCLGVEDVRFVQGEGIISEDEKCTGMQRLQLLTGIPEGQYEFNFVYYLEVFGEVNLAD